MSKRRKFSDEFKREAMGLTHHPGASLSQVARDIAVDDGMLSRWRRELASGKAKAFPALPPVWRGPEYRLTNS